MRRHLLGRLRDDFGSPRPTDDERGEGHELGVTMDVVPRPDPEEIGSTLFGILKASPGSSLAKMMARGSTIVSPGSL